MIELLSALAIWKLTLMLQDFDGPLDIVKIFREWVESHQTKRKLLNFDCFFCLSMVVALPLAILLTHSLLSFLIYWFGLSGGASICNAIYQHLE